jgi:hypothetical protein
MGKILIIMGFTLVCNSQNCDEPKPAESIIVNAIGYDALKL